MDSSTDFTIHFHLGTRTKLSPPNNVYFQWAEKGSYRLEQMLETIKHLPNRYNIFNQKGYAIYVLDDYAVHLMPEVREALLKRGYVLVIIGGGITGDIQINDTHFHAPLKASYRDQEMSLMLEKLRDEPSKIPSPSRDEIMKMSAYALENIKIDCQRAFKSLFVTNSLDGSEDYLVSDKIFRLIGPKMLNFREKLMNEESPKTFKDMLKTITPPKGIKRRPNIEGVELLDCDGDELEDQENSEGDDSEEEDDETDKNCVNNNDKASKEVTSLNKACNNPEINSDAKFLDKFQALLESTNDTSKLFTPYLSQLKTINCNARRSLKKRIHKELQKGDSNLEVNEAVPRTVNEDVPRTVIEVNQGVEDSMVDNDGAMELLFDNENEYETNMNPKTGEHWTVKNGVHSLYAIIISEIPLTVKYFEPTVRGQFHCLNEKVFDVFPGDLEQKINAPTIIQKGSYRKYYTFK